MTTEEASAATTAESRSRRKAYFQKILLASPLVLLLGYRLNDLGDVGVAGWLWGLGLGALLVGFSFVTVLTMTRRRLRGLAALAGRHGWAALCADPDQPQQWQALIVDADGVRSVDKLGRSCRAWKYENIRDVRVERFPLEIITRPGVVLYLVDDSRAEILLAGGIGYTAFRAEAAAKQIRRQLAAFRSHTTPRSTQYRLHDHPHDHPYDRPHGKRPKH